MEDQFRREPGDRMMLLHTFRSLNYVLEDTSPFSAHFFMKLFSYMMNQNIGLPDSHSSNLHSPTGSMMSFSDSESVFQGMIIRFVAIFIIIIVSAAYKNQDTAALPAFK